jgi:hypothetical protein
MQSRPNLESITAAHVEMKKSSIILKEEPKDDLKFAVKPAWYPDLKKVIDELESLKGFYPSMANRGYSCSL